MSQITRTPAELEADLRHRLLAVFARRPVAFLRALDLLRNTMINQPIWYRDAAQLSREILGRQERRLPQLGHHGMRIVTRGIRIEAHYPIAQLDEHPGAQAFASYPLQS